MKNKLFRMFFCIIFSNTFCMEQQGFAFDLTDDDVRTLYDDLKTEGSETIFHAFKVQLASFFDLNSVPGVSALQKKLEVDYEELKQMVVVMFHRQSQEAPPMEFYQAAHQKAKEVNQMVEECVVSALTGQLAGLR